MNVPRARRAGGGQGAGRGSRPPADHCRHARHQRLVDLLRTDEVDVRIDAACRDDHAFSGDDLRRCADDDVHAGLDVRVARFAKLRDAAALDRYVALDDARPVDDERVGDDRIRALLGRALALPHAVSDHLAAAELHFLAVDSEIILHFDDDIGVGEVHAVADRGPEHLGIGAAADLHRELGFDFGFLSGRAFFARVFTAPVLSSGPMTAAVKPYTIRAPESATNSTVRSCPGSKRTAVPAAMLRRKPRAAARSKASAALVSAK